MTELEVARSIRDGALPSPTTFGSMALFALRVTGTGLSYRSAHDELVWRDPSIYLNDEFLARCNGLPVIWEHPTEVASLDSKEFGTRVIGTVMLPYIRDEDVWCIARIYDAESIKLMSDGQLSTSPSVVFKPTDGNEKRLTDDGQPILIEGTPSYLDHLAVCAVGVWDKEGPPTGVQNDTLTEGATAMADEKEKAAADAARHDEALSKMDARLDAALSKMDAMMDAFEKERKDAKRHDAARKDKFGKRRDGESYADWSKRHDEDENAMKDALRKDSDASEEDCMDAAKDARHDAEEEEKRHDKDFEKWAKEDAAEEESGEDKEEESKEEKAEKEEEKPDSRKDSAMARENAEMKERLARLERQLKGITTELPTAERDALAAAQARADSVAAMFGDRAPPAISGETSVDYRKRLLSRFQKHSPTFKDTRLTAFDSATLAAVEDRVYADALSSARAPGDATPGMLIPFEERDRAGRIITRYHGDIAAFMEPFIPQSQQIVKLNRNPKGMN